MPNAETTIETRPQLEAGLAAMLQSRIFMVPFLEAMSDEEFYAAPIAKFHNAAYIAGHLAWAEDMFASKLGGASTMNETHAKLFAFGATPDANDRTFTKAETLGMLNESRSLFARTIRGLSDEQLEAANEGDLAKIAPTVVELAQLCAWHESMHTGQLSAIRRALGHPPLFG